MKPINFYYATEINNRMDIHCEYDYTLNLSLQDGQPIVNRPEMSFMRTVTDVARESTDETSLPKGICGLLTKTNACRETDDTELGIGHYLLNSN